MFGSEMLEMIATVQEFAPGVRTVVWDLGLHPQQVSKVSSIIKAHSNRAKAKKKRIFFFNV